VHAKEWIALEFRVHDTEPDVIDARSPMCGVEDALTESLTAPPHRLIGTRAGGHHLVLFVVTTDRQAVFVRARVLTPPQGMASVTARVWSRDPRSASEEPETMTLVHAQPYRLAQRFTEIVARHLSDAGPLCSWSKH
jgi:hypothetical protein